jgi:murein DD-endopeptidase MepM/ murein hydrolase activator NlpD
MICVRRSARSHLYALVLATLAAAPASSAIANVGMRSTPLDQQRLTVPSCGPDGSGSRATKIKCTFLNPRGKGEAPDKTPDAQSAGGGGPGPAPQPETMTKSPGFAYFPPGELAPQDKGRGRAGDRKVYLPDIVYPLKLSPVATATLAGGHAHMNSQIWGYGGGGWNGKGAAGGSECDGRNYNPMMQRDDYCEVRGWDMPMCPAGQGHQGQDIRPPSCQDDKWEVVAVVDGIITQVTSNTTVRLKGADGTEYYYLHMHPDSIGLNEGDKVKQGQVLGRVSNFMNGGRQTTHHLHFQVRQAVKVNGEVQRVYVPVFASLIAAYRRSKGLDAGIGPDGNLIIDPALEIGAAQNEQKPKPAFTVWPIPNLTGLETEAIGPISLAPAFRPADAAAKATLTVSGLPAGLMFDPATGTVSGTLDDAASRGGDKGVYTVTVKASDGKTGADGKTGTAVQSFTITAKNAPPKVVAATAPQTGIEGSPLTVDAKAAFTDSKRSKMSFSAKGLPDGLEIDPATGVISGRLVKGTASGGTASGASGVFAVQVTAADEEGATGRESFTITVLPAVEPPKPESVTLPPVIVQPIPSVAAFNGREISAIDAAAGFKAGSDTAGALTFGAEGLPPGLAIDPLTGFIKGTLAEDASKSAEGGRFPVTVTARDEKAGATRQSFTITARYQPPQIDTPVVNKTYREGDAVLIVAGGSFTSTDPAGLTFSASGLPEGLTLDPVKGVITGTLPKGASTGGEKGVYTVLLTATDTRSSKTSQSFTIKAEPPPPPAPPQITFPIPDVAGVEGQVLLPIDSAIHFKPAQGDGPLRYTATGLPQNLILEASSGLITGVLAADAARGGANGFYTVEVSARDTKTNLSSTQTFKIAVAARPVELPPAPKPAPPKLEPIVVAPEPIVKPDVTVAPAPAPQPPARTWTGWAYEKVTSVTGWFWKK